MDKTKLENINIEQHKELFEYEMTEVILNLKGEFAVVSSQFVLHKDELPDAEKLSLRPMEELPPVKMEKMQPVALSAPPKCVAFQLEKEFQITPAPARKETLAVQKLLNNMESVQFSQCMVSLPAWIKLKPAALPRPIPQLTAVKVKPVLPIDKVAAAAAKVTQAHLPEVVQVALKTKQHQETFSKLAALVSLTIKAGKIAGLKKDFAYTVKPTCIARPKAISIPEPLAPVKMQPAYHIAYSPVKPVEISCIPVLQNDAASIQGAKCLEKAKQLSAIHASLMPALQNAAAIGISLKNISAQCSSVPEISVEKYTIAPVKLENTTLESTLKTNMTTVPQIKPIPLKTALVSVKPCMIDVRMPEIRTDKLAFIQQEIKVDNHCNYDAGSVKTDFSSEIENLKAMFIL